MTRLSVLAATLVGVGCGGAGSHPTATPRPLGCLDQTAATAVWRQVDQGLNAVAADPGHRGLDDVATGPAAATVRDYIASVLTAHHLTERQADSLDSLVIVDPGCGSHSLVIEVTETLVRDDYLRADGGVDHVDPQVGSQVHLRLGYVRSGSSWKLSELTSLDAGSTTLPPSIV